MLCKIKCRAFGAAPLSFHLLPSSGCQSFQALALRGSMFVDCGDGLCRQGYKEGWKGLEYESGSSFLIQAATC